MKLKLFTICVLILALCLSACTAAGTGPSSQGTTANPTESTPAPTQKRPAPDFTVYDLEGNPVKLSDFQGKPVVLNFWASWCGPCKREMPDFEEAYAAYGQQVHFVMVNLTDGTRETTDTVKAFLNSVGYTFPVYCDTTSQAAIAYNVNSIPTTYFIDAEGYAVAYASGALDSESLEKGIGMIYTP